MSTPIRLRWTIPMASVGLIGLIAVVLAATSPAPAPAIQEGTQNNGYIGGTVTSSNGPEAGVWVIAETHETLTPLIKIVVTDDDGRFMLPELPDHEFDIWVRGYGLVDSATIRLRPNHEDVELTAVVATTPQEAAQYYPGDYWWSMIDFPDEDQFPGTGADGNGISEQVDSQANYIHRIKSNCNFCHQIGNSLTRSLDHVYENAPIAINSDREAWDYRLQGGVRGGSMSGVANQMGREGILDMLVDWTDRIQAGEVPETPPRPDGIEQNVVLTLWDWGTDHSFMHDQITTDKNNPTTNAYGPAYAVDAGHGGLVVLDPIEHSAYSIDIPTREPAESIRSRFPAPNPPSLWWGDQHLWGPGYNPADPHNPMLDSKGRVWMTSKIRAVAPAWCGDAAVTEYAGYFPLGRGGRQASFYVPETGEFELIETCFSTHHLQFDTDENETLYFNELSGSMFGWVDTKIYDQTGDEQLAVGWCGQVVDTNGDGKITLPFNRPVGRGANLLYLSDTPDGPPAGGRGGGAPPANAGPPDPNLDTAVNFNMYSVIPSPVSNVVWGANESYPGHLVRLSRGNNPPETCVTEVFQVPAPGLDPRGLDIDSNGVVYMFLAASSHIAAFDYTQCGPLTAEQKMDGSGCQEGWTLYRTEGPTFPGTDVPSDFHYFGWVDQHNILGLGKDAAVATGSNSDSLKHLNPETGEWTTLRVPYPMGFYSRGLDGRIDDPDAGWKGRALWSNYGTHFVWHIEGGKGTLGKEVKFQIRPDPLAR